MTERSEFSVFQFFLDDSYERVLSFVSAERAVRMAGQLSRSVGGQIGTTKRIIITDGGDSIAFEWQFGRGVTFPSSADLTSETSK